MNNLRRFAKPQHVPNGRVRDDRVAHDDGVRLTDDEIKAARCKAHRPTYGHRAEANLDNVLFPWIKPDTPCLERCSKALHPHQVNAVKFLMAHRGLIAAHGTGSGKTLLAVAASQCALDENPSVNIVVVMPLSLIDNFREGMKEFGVSPEDPHYSFHTLDRFATLFTQHREWCARNVFLIIDEAHNFRTDIATSLRTVNKRSRTDDAGEEKRAPKAVVAIECAKQVWKVLLLTATPVYDNPYDVANLVAMVKGEDGLTANEFAEKEKDDAWFRHYFSNVFSFYTPPRDSARYPAVNEYEVEIEMTPEYYAKYHEVEEELNTKFGNPWEFYNGVRQSTMGLEPSQKCDWVVDHIKKKNPALPTVIYSSFLAYGLEMIKPKLTINRLAFAEITGETPEQGRQEIVNRFNDGGVRILLISGAGSEGLNLRGTRQVVLLESGWNRAGQEQVIGRAVRDGSHAHLPPAERTVDVYHMILTKPTLLPPGDKRAKSADQILQDIIAKKDVRNRAFLDRLQTLSV